MKENENQHHLVHNPGGGDAAFSRVIPSGRGRKAASPIPTDWKRFRFGDLFTPVKRKNTEKNGNVLTISAQDGLVDQLEFYNHPYASEDTSGYTLLTKGEFAYNKSYSGDCPYGAIKRLERYEAGVVSPLYLCFSPKPGVDGDFFVHYFNGGMLNRALYRIAQEGARNHGLLNIPTEGFFDAELIVPSPAEQRRITAILSACDRVVESKQKLLEEKKRQKRALMRMLLEPEGGDAAFSRVGGTRPEGRISRKGMGMRLSAASVERGREAASPCEWKRVCLGEIGRITTGKTPSTTNVESFGGNVPFITPGDFSDAPYITKTERTLTTIGARESRVFPPRTIYTVCIGATVGKVGVCPVRATCNQQINALEVSPEYDALFCYYAVRHHFNKGKGRLVGAETLPLVNKTDYSQFSIPVPPLSEQRYIATILSAADREIDGLAREIDAWKQKRKALSQLLLSGKVRV